MEPGAGAALGSAADASTEGLNDGVGDGPAGVVVAAAAVVGAGGATVGAVVGAAAAASTRSSPSIRTPVSAAVPVAVKREPHQQRHPLRQAQRVHRPAWRQAGELRVLAAGAQPGGHADSHDHEPGRGQDATGDERRAAPVGEGKIQADRGEQPGRQGDKDECRGSLVLVHCSSRTLPLRGMGMGMGMGLRRTGIIRALSVRFRPE